MTLRLCVLLWAVSGQEDALTEYEDRVLRLVPRHGGEVVSRVRRATAGASDAAPSAATDAPLEVQVIHLPDTAALAAYMSDPERLALAGMHEQAVARTEVFEVDTLI
ncbi:hypothetical protein ACFWHR_12345 [Leucobacter sp. NPDC058333]|uniref:hypothetical protein n=1 Tax=Leucobacter sp. NPDC058333 TaxID=3346450 RepID=UPI00366960F5